MNSVLANKNDCDNVYDVLVIGGGPAGCEASAAAARSGASSLCISINIDTVGLNPGSPVLAEGEDDPRYLLIEELGKMGGMLPRILRTKELCPPGSFAGALVADRRQLSLAYQEALQSEDVEIRQALVTSLKPAGKFWTAGTNLGESFMATSIVLAAGTFLRGIVEEGGSFSPGGRRSEIPAKALARCLDGLGVNTERVRAVSSPHLDSRSLAKSGPGADRWLPEVVPGELYGTSTRLAGNRASALSNLSSEFPQPWLTRPGYAVHHQILSVKQVGASLEAGRLPGLFFAGRAAGCSYFAEAAVLGAIAGKNASLRAGKSRTATRVEPDSIAARLCRAVACGKTRPVTIACTTKF